MFCVSVGGVVVINRVVSRLGSEVGCWVIEVGWLMEVVGFL